MKKLLIILLLLALAAVTAWQLREKFRRTGEPLQLYGNVDIRGVDLGFRVAGRLIEVLKDEGDAVQAGELLARLDAQPNAHELARADAQVAAAAADLRLKHAGNRSQDIEQGRAALEESRVVANNAARAYARHAGLVGRGGTSQQDLETAEATRDEAQQRVKVSVAKLRLLEAGFRDEEIAAADAALAQAQAARASAALHVADTELKAPSAGIVLTRALEPGAIVQAGATVLALSLEQPVWVRAYVHESQLGRVPPGTKVLLTTDGQPGRPFHGKVGFVSPRAEFTPKSVETPELRTSLVYRLRVVVDDPDGSLRQGMPVTVLLDPTSP
ncbi:MAG: secretion protein HlyD [Verrucomicrobiota bacterium]